VWISLELFRAYSARFNRVIQAKNPAKFRGCMAYPHIHVPYYYNYYKIIIYIFICGLPKVIHNIFGWLRKVDL
jgi:hypothetical protein